ncbi:hypothetical protein L9F63_013743, partial [Diploptera punctata]
MTVNLIVVHIQRVLAVMRVWKTVFDISNEDFSSSSPLPKFVLTTHSDDSSPEDGTENITDTRNSVGLHSISPPYKKVRALRLFDSPATPKTLLEKCSLLHTPATTTPRSRLFGRIEKPKGVASAYPKLDKPTANVNPFTPNGMLLMSKKRTRSKRSLVGSPDGPTTPSFQLNDSEGSDSEVEQPTKRLALGESNIPRYFKEFLEVRLIGTGEFGSVYECINRLDGCTYAVKKALNLSLVVLM